MKCVHCEKRPAKSGATLCGKCSKKAVKMKHAPKPQSILPVSPAHSLTSDYYTRNVSHRSRKAGFTVADE